MALPASLIGLSICMGLFLSHTCSLYTICKCCKSFKIICFALLNCLNAIGRVSYGHIYRELFESRFDTFVFAYIRTSYMINLNRP